MDGDLMMFLLGMAAGCLIGIALSAAPFATLVLIGLVGTGLLVFGRG